MHLDALLHNTTGVGAGSAASHQEPPSRIRECAQIISGGLKAKSPSQAGRG
jgi:hypothetical protein